MWSMASHDKARSESMPLHRHKGRQAVSRSQSDRHHTRSSQVSEKGDGVSRMTRGWLLTPPPRIPRERFSTKGAGKVHAGGRPHAFLCNWALELTACAQTKERETVVQHADILTGVGRIV